MNTRQKHPELIICMILIIAILGVYWQVQHYEFVNLDDDHYIAENPNIRNGLTKDGLLWALNFNDVSYWHPLTWLSHMLDCQLYGVNPQGHHFNSLLLHIINALLLFLILKRMTGALWRSAAVAALFALHPINVESVAWVTNRKSVLSTFFWLLTIGTYVYYARRPGVLRYLVVFLCFAFGLLAKPMVVTLPFVLLLLDYWPLGRVQFGSSAKTVDSRDARLTQTRFERASASHLILEKVPIFVLSAASIYISFLSSRSLGILVTSDTIPVSLRIQNAMVSYVNYILKMIWPRDLVVFYPYPEAVPLWQFAGATIVVAGLSILAFRTARRVPYLTVGWLWYLGTLLPVIGLVQHGLWPSFADRFAYIPLIGLFISTVWGLASLGVKWRLPKIIPPAAVCMAIALLGIGTWAQAKYWKNSITLFDHALDVTTDNHLAHYNMAAAFHEQGDLGEAVLHYSEALRIIPNNAQFHYGLGTVLLKQGRIEQALMHLSEALKLVPRYAEAHVNMGSALVKRGNFEEAISHYRQALEVKPIAEAHHGLGLVLAGQGSLGKAISHYGQAIKMKPGYAEAHNDLGVALSRQGKFREAIWHFSEALRIKPDYDSAGHNLKVISSKLNDQKGRLQDRNR
jgi:tetratricopeptide (TPR) repeat protein